MRLSRSWKLAALSGALLCGACSKGKEQAPAEPAAEPAQAPKPAAEPAAEPEAQAEAPSKEPEDAAEDDGTPPEFTIGQRREEVMKLFKKCAERRFFEPPGPGKLYVEIYQPKDTEACKQRLGERQFMIVGGRLKQITPGLIPPEPPRQEPPEGS